MDQISKQRMDWLMISSTGNSGSETRNCELYFKWCEVKSVECKDTFDDWNQLSLCCDCIRCMDKVKRNHGYADTQYQDKWDVVRLRKADIV